MNLAIDIGNTRLKLGLFENNELLHTISIATTSEPGEIIGYIEQHPRVRNIIISSSGESLKNFSSLSNKRFVMELNYNTPLPFENLYRTPVTLGTDRIALAGGANSRFRGENVLTIDTGTCITLDFVNASNQYIGGSISPGIKARFKALNNFTSNLPLVKFENKEPVLLTGNDTNNSILSGVINGAVAEMRGLAGSYLKKYDQLKIILTGGDYRLFEKDLAGLSHSKKNQIFADPNLVLYGLNTILNFNVK